VTTLPIVKHFDVVEKSNTGGVARSQRLVEFGLERAEETPIAALS